MFQELFFLAGINTALGGPSWFFVDSFLHPNDLLQYTHPYRHFTLYILRGTMTIPIFDDIALARRTVLRRVPLDEIEISPAMLDANERIYGARLTPAEAVDRIILDVRGRGDAALSDWSARLDGVRRLGVRGAAHTHRRALGALAPELARCAQAGRGRDRALSSPAGAQLMVDFNVEGALGQLVVPLQRVGLYAPGGSAPLPSSLLMAAIPRASPALRRSWCAHRRSAIPARLLRSCWRQRILPAWIACLRLAARRRLRQWRMARRLSRRSIRSPARQPVCGAGEARGLWRGRDRGTARPDRDAGDRRRDDRPAPGGGRSAGAGRARRGSVGDHAHHQPRRRRRDPGRGRAPA